MKIPIATYRLQFNPEFGFQKAREILSYLAELGISDIYASPVFKAKAGSPHGYDVVDLNQLNPDLGLPDDFKALTDDVKQLDMGWLQDIVPNHMAFDGENQMLMDVLENGRHSEFFDYFDIEWAHFYDSLSERLLAPFLGKHYSECLDAGEIILKYDSNGFSINYYMLKLPLKIESYARMITHRLQTLRKKLGDDHTDLIKFHGILYSLKNLPETEEERLGRYSQIQFIKSMLWELYNGNEDIKKFIDKNIQTFNGRDKSGGNMSLLESLLSEQLFRLSFWKVATEELNYRRFFNINGLISVRVEEERVFNNTHRLILKLVKDRTITGLRIDHIDGLYDPTAYLRKLKDNAGDIYIIVEKILEFGEELPSLWAVQGTTGYDFLNYVNGIFCDENNGRAFNKLYYSYTGFKISYEAMLYEKKRLVIEKDMTGDVDNLAHLLKRISSNDRIGGDITLYGLKRAIKEILALFPVYRTYTSSEHFSDTDRGYITETINTARDMNPALLYEMNFIERFLLLEFGDETSVEDQKEWVHFVMRFQQLTGPLMAKGFEDTTLYVYNRLLSLNDVGGSPDRFGISVGEFHEFNEKRALHQPHSMNATATHDTKRGEDVRARINVLSEIPELWESSLRKWSKLNRRRKKAIRGSAVPERNDEYFLYQTMIGAMPFDKEEIDSFRGRLKNYIIKAVREAKVHTAWLKPDSDYEDNFMAFIDKILIPSDKNNFLNEFMTFQSMIADYAVYNSLSQVLIKATAPGFPDMYQGSEFWDFNLVDPDNRRPVDFELRTWLFRELKAKDAEDSMKLINELFSTRKDGRIKLYLMYKALAARIKYKSLFEKGSYIPVETDGTYKNHIIAFVRERRPSFSITVAPRFLTGVVKQGVKPVGREVWKDTRIILPEGTPVSWKDVITGTEIRGKKKLFVGDIIKHFPTSLLVSNTKK
ncbi:MAG: malto-oligosyltrehalose synthase [Nitrospiraceae bacterium]|nr:MAG: malto-oligosyltrehalose synthase [Nitrospiraceae bacterium]